MAPTLASTGRYECRLWDIATGRLLLELGGGDFNVALAFSPDGRKLALGNVRNGSLLTSIYVWNLQFGRGIQQYRGLTNQIVKVCFSRDGRLLAGLAHDWQVGIWEVRSGELLHVLSVPKGITADNSGLAFSPDGRRFAFAAGREAKLWDVGTGQELKSWQLPEGFSDALAFDRLGKLLLFRWEKGVCISRDLLSQTPTTPLGKVYEFSRCVYGIVTNSDGNYFAVEGKGGAAGKRHSINVYDPSGKEVLPVPTELKRGNSAR